MHTPWGSSQQTLTVETGVHWVSTASHGGLMVKLTKAHELFTEKALAIAHPGICGEYVCFEEDCSYAVAFMEQPRFKRELDRLNLADWERESYNPNNQYQEYMAKAKAEAVPKLRAAIAQTDDQIKSEMQKIVERWNPEYFFGHALKLRSRTHANCCCGEWNTIALTDPPLPAIRAEFRKHIEAVLTPDMVQKWNQSEAPNCW